MTTLHCVLALATREDMELVQMDVKTAFLHGDLHLYGLKQHQGNGIINSICSCSRKGIEEVTLIIAFTLSGLRMVA